MIGFSNMDVHVFRGRAAIQKRLVERRLENQIEQRLARFSGEENSKMADVLTRSFVASSGNGLSKEYGDVRQNSYFDQHTKTEIKPEYMSLADIYEGALRKVLNLQLNLRIEEHPRFHGLNDVQYSDKSSPPRPRAIRVEDPKQNEEYRHHRRSDEDKDDARVTPQGHKVLRKVGERSPAEGSAFHVPSKRRYDVHNFTSMERESDVPVDRFGAHRRADPEFPGEFRHSSYNPHLYGPRMDSMRGPRLGPPLMDPRSTTHERYSRYPSHQREIPPLFPVHCSTSERDGPSTPRSTEPERREGRYPDVSAINGIHGTSGLKYTNSKKFIMKLKEEKEHLEEKFNKASKSLNIQMSALSSDHNPTHSDHIRSYSRQTRPDSSPKNGCEDNEKPHQKLRNEKKLCGEEGEKEEFLSSLGLARIF